MLSFITSGCRTGNDDRFIMRGGKRVVRPVVERGIVCIAWIVYRYLKTAGGQKALHVGAT